jgi:hypothetical protein
VIPRLAVLSVLALAVLAVAGCADAVAGTPAATTATSTSMVTSMAPVSAAINPCTLLTADDIQGLGITPRGPDTLGGSRGCSWTKNGQYVVGFSVLDHLGIDQANSGGNPITNHPVGSHDGRQFEGALGGCAVALAITETSSVDVVVGGDQTQECQLADQFAQLIEPKLPAERK